MVLKIDDWEFDIDLERTMEHSSLVSQQHCTCAYCENYYLAAGAAYPNLGAFLSRFGVNLDAPSEMYPFEPTLCLTGYRIYGSIVRVGCAPMMVDGVPVMPDILDAEQFMLEVGEMPLPWVMEEDMDAVISPANEPEFLEKMYRKLLSRSSGFICS